MENKQQSAVKEPKREDFRDEIDFELARIDYCYRTPDYRIQNIVQMMESQLLFKLGMNLSNKFY